MRRVMLLAMALAALIPASAKAEGAHSHVTSSFGIKIVVRDTPRVAHAHQPIRHLRPQPVPRYFHHHAPRSSWHKPWRAGANHFRQHWGGHERSFRGPRGFGDADRIRGSHRASHERSGPRHGRGGHR